jgi:broad-specificity NMP kinase
MIRDISQISDFPPELLKRLRECGWTDDEILENLQDAIDFVNQLCCEREQDDLTLTSLFSEH